MLLTIGVIVLLMGIYILTQNKIPFVKEAQYFKNYKIYCKINGVILTIFGIVVIIFTRLNIAPLLMLLIAIILTIVDTVLIKKFCS